jgi:hypothetical protein
MAIEVDAHNAEGNGLGIPTDPKLRVHILHGWEPLLRPCNSVQQAASDLFRATRNDKQGATANTSGSVRKGIELGFSAYPQVTEIPLTGFPS